MHGASRAQQPVIRPRRCRAVVDGGRTVIVVDDEPDIVDAISLLLESKVPDVQVRGTTSAAEALDLTRKGADLMLTDFRMPGMNGIELAQRAKALDPALPIVLVTAYPEAALDRRAASAGIGRVLRKPLDPVGFLDAVRGQLARPSGP